jgi:hypothetical protein
MYLYRLPDYSSHEDPERPYHAILADSEEEARGEVAETYHVDDPDDLCLIFTTDALTARRLHCLLLP